jgi:pyrimidine-specific ribonucleoside hydrolase
MSSRRFALLGIGLVLVASACNSSAPETATSGGGERDRTAVIVDYSPTVSDVGGLMYLLAHPEVDVLAVTVPVTGEAGCDLGIEVTLGILAMHDRDDIPVACDPRMPASARSWPPEFLTGNEGLTSGLPASTATASESTAGDLIAETAAAADAPVTIYAVAPLTNLARALGEHPDLAGHVEEVVIMGGAVGVPGNVPETGAEWNIWIDASAASAVFESEVPVTLVPLDATNHVPVPIWYEQALAEAPQSDAIVYLSRMVKTFPAVTSGFYLWDELAASVAGGEETVTTENMNVTVDESGATVADASASPLTVATAVGDPTGFTTHFLSVLAGRPVATPGPTTEGAGSPPDTVLSTTPPDAVLAFWLSHALQGDPSAASSVVAPGTAWIEGFGASAEEWIDGSEPFDAVDIAVSCGADGQVAVCNATWTDAWIAPIPDIDLGRLRMEADVTEGTVVAFRTLEFSNDVVTAFGDHLAWLEAKQPEAFARDCATAPTAEPCSALLVATVADWIAAR